MSTNTNTGGRGAILGLLGGAVLPAVAGYEVAATYPEVVGPPVREAANWIDKLYHVLPGLGERALHFAAHAQEYTYAASVLVQNMAHTVIR